MSTQVTRRCHWVPQSYLKAFSADDQQKKIWRFSKNSGLPEIKPIKKVAVKFHLYSPTGADGRRNDALEKKLSELEKWFGGDAWASACHDFPDYSWTPLRKMMALLVASMYVRNPVQFDHWKRVHGQIKEMILAADDVPSALSVAGKKVSVDPATWPAYRDATEEDLKASWNEYVGQAAGIAEKLLAMRWAVLVSDHPAFVTSDNPVIMGDTVSPFRGIKHPDTIVIFPISPTRVLMMDNRHTEPDARYYRVQGVGEQTNLLTWRNSMEYMFAHRDPHLVSAEMLAAAERDGF